MAGFLDIIKYLNGGDEEAPIDPSNNDIPVTSDIPTMSEFSAAKAPEVTAPRYQGMIENPYTEENFAKKRAQLSMLRNPEDLAELKRKSEPSVAGNILRGIARAAQFTPRGAGIGSRVLGMMEGGDRENREALAKRIKDANELETGMREDLRASADIAKSNREQESHNIKMLAAGDPTAKEVFIKTMASLNPNIFDKDLVAKMRLLSPEAVYSIGLNNFDREKLMSEFSKNAADNASREKVAAMNIAADKEKLLAQGGGVKLTPGQEAEDKAYGKKRVENQQTFGKFDADLKEAQSIIGELTKEGAPRNPISQFVPDAFGMGKAIRKNLNPEYESLAERSKNILRRNMRASGLLPPGPASDIDVENAIATIWDSNLPNAENARRLQDFMDRTKVSHEQELKRAREYEAKGTLSQFSEDARFDPSNNPQSQKIKVSNGTETLMIDAADLPEAEKDKFYRVK